MFYICTIKLITTMSNNRTVISNLSKEEASYWQIQQKKIIVEKEFFRNGEFYIRGHYEDDKVKICFPSIFFNDDVN